MPYLSMEGNLIMGNGGFRKMGGVSSPVRFTGCCDSGNTSRLIFCSVATSFRGHKLFASVLGRITDAVFVPLAINKNVGALSSFSHILGYNTSGIDMGSNTVGGPDLVCRTTGHCNSRYIMVSTSIGHISNIFEIFSGNNERGANVRTIS